MSKNVEQKTINNAIAAYLMVFISWLLLLNKDNKYINNDFVKNHTKSSIIIHIMFLINYIIFISNWLLYQIEIIWYWINIIIANIIFLALIWLSILWIYKSSKWEMFYIWNFIKTNKNIKLEVTNEVNYDEKDKLSIILSYIPFIWYIIWSKYENNSIKNIIKLNLLISIIIYLFFIFWYNNLTSLFVLWYTIFIIFVWINFFSRNELINFELPYYFLPSWKIILQKTIIKYIYNYLKWNFDNFENTKKSIIQKQETIKEKEINEIKKLNNIKINKTLIYIPFINLIFLKEFNSKYHLHIKNWLVITLIFTLLIILNIFNIIYSTLFISILFPISFGIWKLHNEYYKMPYIYEIYQLIEKIIKYFKKTKKILKEKHNEENNLNLKVK